ncbi:MAG: MgtC/SapB family protein [Acidaminobacteraceae bacterium]
MDYDIFLRVGMACFFGGLIGIERESVNRPAGFRTHMLVCLGASIVMLSNIYLLEEYGDIVNVDPGRYGAQVISGIGFLGAGTIIKEGFSVRGLTTAASLWAVACIGLVIGAGHYSLAIFATVMVFLILETFSRLEKRYKHSRRELVLYLKLRNIPGQLGKVTSVIGSKESRISNIAMKNTEDDTIGVKIYIKYPKGITELDIIEALTDTDGVLSIKMRE